MALHKFLERLPPGRPIRVTVAEHEGLSTTAQRARWWGLVGLIADHMVPDGQRFRKEFWAEHLKAMFIDPEEIRMPSGRRVYDYPSFSELSEEEADGLLWSSEAWASERGIVPPSTDD